MFKKYLTHKSAGVREVVKILSTLIDLSEIKSIKIKPREKTQMVKSWDWRVILRSKYKKHDYIPVIITIFINNDGTFTYSHRMKTSSYRSANRKHLASIENVAEHLKKKLGCRGDVE